MCAMLGNILPVSSRSLKLTILVNTMDEEKLKRAAGLLKEVSDMLLTVETSASTSSRTDSSDSSTMRPAITTPIAETLSVAVCTED